MGALATFCDKYTDNYLSTHSLRPSTKTVSLLHLHLA